MTTCDFWLKLRLFGLFEPSDSVTDFFYFQPIKIWNQRRDFLHKLNRKIADQYNVVAVEDINMKAMGRCMYFWKSVPDNSCGKFGEILEYKLRRHGKRLVKDDLRQSIGIIRELSEDTRNGRRFIIFPEGGYAHNHNTLGEFKPGCFKSAMKARVPIVPVALIDSYKVFEEWTLKKVETQVHFLKAIPYEEYKGMTTIEIAQMVKEQIARTIAENRTPKSVNTENLNLV